MDKFVKPKLAREVPAEKQLEPKDFERLDEEARAWRKSVDKHAARIEAIDHDDLRVRVR